jgi:hypothetical protein
MFEEGPDTSSSDTMHDLHSEHRHTLSSLMPANRRPHQNFGEKCVYIACVCVCVFTCMCVYCMHVHSYMTLCSGLCMYVCMFEFMRMYARIREITRACVF